MNVHSAPIHEALLGEWCRAVALDDARVVPVLPQRREARESLARLLIANRLATLVVHALARAPTLTAVVESDPAFAAALRDEARRAAEQGLAAIAVLRAVEAALSAADVPWILWKGPALSVQLWGEPVARAFGDLDVVVAPAQRAQARAALERAGWHLRGGLAPRGAEAVYAGTQAYPLDHEGAPLLELHWGFAGLLYPDVMSVGDVIFSAERVTIAGQSVRTPSGPDALLLLAMHATKHGWSQAEDVVSFARLARRNPSALVEARENAASAGIPRALALAERLTERLGLAVAGSRVRRDAAEEARIEAMADACIARMLAGDGAWRDTAEWTLAWIGRAEDRRRYRAGRLWRPTPIESRWLRLPDALASLYPAVRVARLALRSVGLAPRD